MAPFWTSLYDYYYGGAISYEIFESGYFLEEVNAFLQSKRPTSFEGTWMLVAYYDEVVSTYGTRGVCINLLHVYMLHRVFFLFRTPSKPS